MYFLTCLSSLPTTLEHSEKMKDKNSGISIYNIPRSLFFKNNAMLINVECEAENNQPPEGSRINSFCLWWYLNLYYRLSNNYRNLVPILWSNAVKYIALLTSDGRSSSHFWSSFSSIMKKSSFLSSLILSVS